MSFFGSIGDAFHDVVHAGDAVLHGRFDSALQDLSRVGEDFENIADAALHELEHLESELEEFGGRMLADVEQLGDDAFHQAEAGLMTAVDAVVDEASDIATAGTALLSDGVAMVGSAVEDFAEAAEQGLEDLGNDIADGVADAANWLRDQATEAVDELGHTMQHIAAEAKKGFETLAEDLEDLANQLLDMFRDFANLKAANKIKQVLDHLIHYGFQQAARAFSGVLEIAPSMLEHGGQLPFIRAARAQLETQQSAVDALVNQANNAMDALGGHGAMSLVNQFMNAAEDVLDQATKALKKSLDDVGLGGLGDAIEGLEHCFDPLLLELHDIFGSGELVLNLHDLLDAIFATMVKLGQWVRTNVTGALDTAAQQFTRAFEATLRKPIYIPGLSELWWGFANWWNTLGPRSPHLPTQMSLLDGITMPVAYFVHVFYRVSSGHVLSIDLNQVKQMTARLPQIPDSVAVTHFFEDWVSQGLNTTTLAKLFAPASGSPTKMVGAAITIAYTVPKPLKKSLSAMFALVDMVAVAIATPGELVINMVSAILKGTTGALRGLLHAVALIGSSATMSTARIALEITTMTFQMFMLPRQLLVGVLASQELAVISTVPGATVKLIEVLIMLADKGSAMALASVKLSEKAISNAAYTFAMADAGAKILATLVGAVPPISKLLADPVIAAHLSALIAAVTDGVGAGTGLGAQATRLADLLKPAVPIIEIARLGTALEHSLGTIGEPA